MVGPSSVPEVPVSCQIPFDGGRQVEVVAARDGHVQDGDEVGQQQRMDFLEKKYREKNQTNFQFA